MAAHLNNPTKRKAATPGEPGRRRGDTATRLVAVSTGAYRARKWLLQGLLLTAVDHRGPAPGRPHDPPAPSLLGIQDAVPGHAQLRFCTRAGATHLTEGKGAGQTLQMDQSVYLPPPPTPLCF